jgi:hypothetical protein
VSAAVVVDVGHDADEGDTWENQNDWNRQRLLCSSELVNLTKSLK